MKNRNFDPTQGDLDEKDRSLGILNEDLSKRVDAAVGQKDIFQTVSKIRLFIAVDLNESVFSQVEKFTSQFREFPELRMIPSVNYHLTLKFLGPVVPHQVPAIIKSLEQVVQEEKPFSVTLKGVGIFPHWRAPRVLWVGVEDLEGQMSALADKLEGALVKLGFERENRKYTPHLTIAKYRRDQSGRSKLRELIDSPKNQKLKFGSNEVREIVLYESCPGPETSLYKPAARFKLGLNS